MNILYLAHRVPYPPDKGDRIRSFHTLRYLARSHRVDCISLTDEAIGGAVAAGLRKLCRRVSITRFNQKLALIKGVAALFRAKPISVGYFYWPQTARIIDRWLQSTRYDAIVCYSAPTAEYLLRCKALDWRRQPCGCRSDRPRLIVDFCDVDSDKWRQYSLRSGVPKNIIYGLEAWALQKYEQTINRLFDHSIFVSNQEVAVFKAGAPAAGRISTIANGVDSAYFQPGAAADTRPAAIPAGTGPVLLFTGAMDYYANVDGVLWFAEHILPRLNRVYPKLCFLVVGRSPDARIRALSGRQGVVVTGFVDDIRPYYQLADLYVAPLRIARGIQNKLLEAMAMGKAVVATPAAASGIEFNGQHPLIVATSQTAFAAAVLELLADSQAANAMGAAARNFVTTFCRWQNKMSAWDRVLCKSV